MNGITIEKNKDITGFTTFGIPVKARYFAEYSSEKELLKISRTDEFIGKIGRASCRERVFYSV